MAPVVKALLDAKPAVDGRICVTGQHREMLDQVLSVFSMKPEWDLSVMRTEQDLAEVTTRVLSGLQTVLRGWRPDLVLVHGDTTTSFAASLAAFYEGIEVGHVEAGLRTWNRLQPWPEEINRRLTGVLASYHFAPTLSAKKNLMRESVSSDRIWVTGNTVVDALNHVVTKTRVDPNLKAELRERFSYLDEKKKLIVVTGHRRENLGTGLLEVCRALRSISERKDNEIVFPVHLNPEVRRPVQAQLGNLPNVHLVDPVDYPTFIGLLDRAYLIITDSGGIQEEAPSLGKPVLVTREVTERPEAVRAGIVRLVGADESAIVGEVSRLLDDSDFYDNVSTAENPYGDGQAASRIVKAILGQQFREFGRGEKSGIKALSGHEARIEQ